jgi:endonuclease-3 related protein
MPASLPESEALASIFRTLEATYGDETWHWDAPHAHGPMDIVVGAVLVQHTTWTNAERALEHLRGAGALDPAVLADLPDDRLIALVRVSGTPVVKARRLHAIARTIVDAGGLAAFLASPKSDLRERLLATHGIGPETADAILLYAANQRVFVVDAYTQRLLRRIGLGPAADSYDLWQRWLEDRLPDANTRAFQRYHAVIVQHGKSLCRPNPRCAACPLLARCGYGATQVSTGQRLSQNL